MQPPASSERGKSSVGKEFDAEPGSQNEANPFESFSETWKVGEVVSSLHALDESFYQNGERLIKLVNEKFPPNAHDQPQFAFASNDWEPLNHQYNAGSAYLENYLNTKPRESGLTQEEVNLIREHIHRLLEYRNTLKAGMQDIETFLAQTDTDERLFGEIKVQLKKIRILNPSRYKKLGAPSPENDKEKIRDEIARTLAQRADYQAILEDKDALSQLAGEVIRKMYGLEQGEGAVPKIQPGIAGSEVHQRGGNPDPTVDQITESKIPVPVDDKNAAMPAVEPSSQSALAASIPQAPPSVEPPVDVELAPEAQAALTLINRWDELTQQLGAEKLTKALSKEGADKKENVSVKALPAIRERLMTLSAGKKLARADRLWVENIAKGMQALTALGERLQKSEVRKQREEVQNKEWAARIPNDERALEKVIIIRKLMRGFIRKSGEKFKDMELNRATALDFLMQGVMEIIDASLEKMTTLEAHQRAALAREIVNSISIRW